MSTVKGKRAALKTATEAPSINADVRLMSKREVLTRTGVCYATLWHWMRAGTFPRARILGGKSCWLEHEFNAWASQLNIRPLKGDAIERAEA